MAALLMSVPSSTGMVPMAMVAQDGDAARQTRIEGLLENTLWDLIGLENADKCEGGFPNSRVRGLRARYNALQRGVEKRLGRRMVLSGEIMTYACYRPGVISPESFEDSQDEVGKALEEIARRLKSGEVD